MEAADVEGPAMAVEAVVKNGGVDTEIIGSLAGNCGCGGVVVLVEVATSCGFAVSTLARGDIDWVRIGDNDLSGFISTVLLLPQKDSNPPPVFFPLAASASAWTTASLLFSTTRQPTGKSSCTTSGRDLTDASHAVEPFDAMS